MSGPVPVRERKMYRYPVPVDDKPYSYQLSGDPVAVAATDSPNFIEFWAEHDDGVPGRKRWLQVFGTGHPLPEGARWIGTCARTAEGLVWHLYEIRPGQL